MASDLRELERYYRERCPSVGRIQISDPGDDGPRRLHAAIVPDFAYLKRRQIANSRKRVRFEVENAAIQLPQQDRIDALSIVSLPAGPKSAVLEETGVSGAAVAELLRQFRPAPAIETSMNLELDLGFDSLDRVQLMEAAGRTFGIEIGDDEATAILTAGDLLSLVSSHGSGQRRKIEIPDWHAILNAALSAQDQRIAANILVRRPAFELISYGLLKTAYAAAKLIFHYRVFGIERLPRDGFAICANHASHLDPLFLACGMPWHIAHSMFFLGFADYFAKGRLAAIWKRLKVLPVDEDRNARSGMRLSVEGIRRGFIACIFPEGERSVDGLVKAFDRGVEMLVAETGVAVVPAGLKGTHEVLPREGTHIPRYPVTVRFGDPIAAQRFTLDGLRSAIVELAQ